jgi:hypothetical protein
MTDSVCNVFISHIHEDDAELGKLKDLIARSGCTVRDASINSDRPNNAQSPEYINQEILAPRICWASTLIVVISPDTLHSEYVNWEIDYAAKQDKRIVGVWAHGANQCELPDALKKHADAIVGWQGDRVVDAIHGRINNWETPDGQACDPQDIKRYRC